jgi:hypothetical protein
VVSSYLTYSRYIIPTKGVFVVHFWCDIYLTRNIHRGGWGVLHNPPKYRSQFPSRNLNVVTLRGGDGVIRSELGNVDIRCNHLNKFQPGWFKQCRKCFVLRSTLMEEILRFYPRLICTIGCTVIFHSRLHTWAAWSLYILIADMARLACENVRLILVGALPIWKMKSNIIGILYFFTIKKVKMLFKCMEKNSAVHDHLNHERPN